MTMRISILFGLTVLSAALLLGACAPAPQGEPTAEPESALVWPPPPAAPRIRYVKSLSSADDLEAHKGFFDGLIAFLKGAREQPLASPYGVAIGPDDQIYVVDTLHKAVKVFDPVSGKTRWFPERPIDGFVNPIDIAVDPGGTIYVSDSSANVVHVFAPGGRDHVGTIGQGLFQRPTGLLLDAAQGELVVVDTKAAALLVFDLAQRRHKRTIGGRGTEAGEFNFPVAIAGDAKTRYVVDSMNFRVQVMDADFAFLDSFGTAGDAPGYFSRPKGAAVDSEGHVYVVDALFDNVQVFDREGHLLMAFGGPGAGPGQFWLPNDIHIDGADRIYVSDSHNRRVQVFEYLPAPAGG